MSEQVKQQQAPPDPYAPMVWEEEDVRPKQVPVRLGKTNYLLISASAEVVARYQSAIRRGMRVGKNADTVEFNDAVGEADLILVAGCLCRTEKDKPDVVSRDASGNPNTVGLPFVKALPYGVQNDLYERAKAITPGMEDPPEPAKKTPEQQTKDEDEAVKNS